MVAWYYPPTLGQKMFNYKRFVNKNTVEKLVQIAQGDCKCHKNPEFMDSVHGHIATCDVKVLGNTQLQNLASMGTKHRW